MHNVNIIFLEKYRSGYVNTEKWYLGKSSLGLEWIIPYLNNLKYETTYVNPNILNNADLKIRSEYIFNECEKAYNNKKINLLITTINDKDINKEFLNRIKKLGIFTINIQNDSWNNQYCYEKINSSFDLQWLPYKPTNYIYKLLKQKKINYIELPWAGIPYEDINKTKINKAFFYGSRNNSREYLIYKLAKDSIGLDIFGGGWSENLQTNNKIKVSNINLKNQLYLMREPYYLKRVSAKIKSYLFSKNFQIDKKLIQKIHIIKGYIESKNRVNELSKYMISVGASSLGSTYVLNKPINFSRGRDWELPGMGVMMITPKDSVLSESFKEDEEMVFYNSYADLKDKLKYYLNNPEISKKIGMSGRQKIKNKHNFDIRIQTIINELTK